MATPRREKSKSGAASKQRKPKAGPASAGAARKESPTEKAAHAHRNGVKPSGARPPAPQKEAGAAERRLSSAASRPSKRAAEAVEPAALAAAPAAPSASAPARKPRSAKVERAASPAAPSEGASGKYVYCIIQSRDTPVFGAIGIGVDPAEVHTIIFKDIAAVVSDTPIEVYDPTRENVLAHERVNETVMRDHTVIPMSFGTVFKTYDDIVELLRSAYDAFRDVLQKMQNKLEFGLKVLWDPEDIIRELEKEDENLRRLRLEMSTRRSSTYFARMQYGRLVDSLLQERCDRYIREIFAALRGVCVASRANKCIGERMIMNAAFLVARDQESEFDAKVKEIGARYHHLTFKYTGPWPPYNFVNIRLKLERAKEA